MGKSSIYIYKNGPFSMAMLNNHRLPFFAVVWFLGRGGGAERAKSGNLWQGRTPALRSGRKSRFGPSQVCVNLYVHLVSPLTSTYYIDFGLCVVFVQWI